MSVQKTVSQDQKKFHHYPIIVPYEETTKDLRKCQYIQDRCDVLVYRHLVITDVIEKAS